MIKIRGKEITKIVLSGIPIAKVYKGGVLVWQAVRSCFGSGMWRNDKPWLNKELWKNN
jgi:hypothetical protein